MHIPALLICILTPQIFWSIKCHDNSLDVNVRRALRAALPWIWGKCCDTKANDRSLTNMQADTHSLILHQIIVPLKILSAVMNCPGLFFMAELFQESFTFPTSNNWAHFTLSIDPILSWGQHGQVGLRKALALIWRGMLAGREEGWVRKADL